MNGVKLFLESCQSLVLYALVALSLGVLTASSAVALMKSVKLSAVKICRCGLLSVFLMSVMLGIGVSIGSVKVPGGPTNQVQQGQVSVEPLRRSGGWPPYHVGGLVGSCFPRDRNEGDTAYPITDEDITNCWRVAEIREGYEIVSRDAFDTSQIHEDWLVRGGFMDVMRIPAVGWSFPWRDGFLEGMTVFSDGGLRPALRTPYFPSPFEAPLAVVPSFNWNLLPGGVSNVFWYAVSPSNSLVVTWENSPVNRDVNCITNFQAEFFADGRFEYRYQDHAVGYAPVFPFDWDGDGLENSVDPEPLVAGPDAHGTNVEWYNVVCSNVYEAVEAGESFAMPALEGTIAGPRDLAPLGISLLPHVSDVNTNAYYFVAVVASRGPAPIYFTADGKSRLGNPVVVARAGETNHVPLLIGASYCISSSVPVTITAPDAVVFSSPSSGGGPMLLGAAPMPGYNGLCLSYPATLDYVDIGGTYTPIVVNWMLLGGYLSWSGGCCMRLAGSTMAFECRSCLCGGCTAQLTYEYEGYAISTVGPSCGCGTGNGCTPSTPSPGEPDVSLAFDRHHVLLSTSCLGYGERSTRTELSISANGGTQGGVLEWGVENSDKLSPAEGDIALSGFCALSPSETFSGARTNAGVVVSDRPRDIRAWAVLYESGTGVRHARESRTTVCRVSVDQIRFNYNFQSYNNDAINIRPNARDDYDYLNGEWAGGGATNNPACYVGTCRPKVRARFRVEPAGVTGARIRALASSQDFTLGDLPVMDVVFSGSNSQWTEFAALEGDEIGWCVNKTAARWDWIISEIETEIFQPFWTDSTGPHVIYTVLDHPTAPWMAARSAAQRPWASALDFACQTAKGASTANAALTAITQKLFSGMGFEYDTMFAQPGYCGRQVAQFELTSYLQRERTNVNCFDQAYGVVSIGNLLGASSRMVVVEQFGFLDTVELIGVGLCNNPVHLGYEKDKRKIITGAGIEDIVIHIPRAPLVDGDSLARSKFDRHAFAVCNGVVYDACVGPSLGTHSISNYIDSAVDHSTINEAANGFFSSSEPGTYVTRGANFTLK